MGIASLVLGIIGMISSITVVLAPIGVVLVLVGLILGIVDVVKKGKTGEKKGITIAGIVISAVFFVVLVVENLIIILGLAVYTTTASNGILANAQKVQSVDLFNSTYEMYEGAKAGNTVRNLLTIVENNNMINKNNTISCQVDGTSASPSILKPRVSTVKRYNVSLSYDEEGYVNKISITTIDEM